MQLEYVVWESLFTNSLGKAGLISFGKSLIL